MIDGFTCVWMGGWHTWTAGWHCDCYGDVVLWLGPVYISWNWTGRLAWLGQTWLRAETSAQSDSGDGDD